MSQSLEPRSIPNAPVAAYVGQATAVEQARAVAEVQAAIIVAQQCPRDMRRAWGEMRAACGRLALANRAFYSVPNRGTGPSVHLARELARIWGNLDYGVKELRRDDVMHESEIQAYAWDQQTNVRSTRSLIVPHARMRGRERQPLTDLGDVYLNNQNVGARAVRECVFTVIPADFVAEAQEICRSTIEKGDGQPLDKRIASMVDAFSGLGVNVTQIETRIGRPRGQWTAVDVVDLSVAFSSIKRGEVTVEQEFPAERVTAAEIAGQHRHPADGRPITPGYMPDPDAAAKAAAFPGYVDPTTLVVPDPDHMPAESAEPNGGASRPMSEGRSKRMFATFRDAGMTDKDEQLAFIAEVIGRDVQSRKEITDDECTQIVDATKRYIEQNEPPTGGAQ